MREEIDITQYFHEERTEADSSVLKDVAERKMVSVETENDEIDGMILKASKMEGREWSGCPMDWQKNTLTL